MPRVYSFDEAIKKAGGRRPALLIGNGFSAEYFNYDNLFAKSGIKDEPNLKNLFDLLDTVDFEAVIRSLEGAILVERAYGNNDHADELEAHAQKVREALVTAVNSTHPPHRQDLELKYESSAEFLQNFSKVFSLNYDLLLYWVNLENRFLRDGFGRGSKNSHGKFQGPFYEDAHCEIYNLHGGLHLFPTSIGEVEKALDTGDGVIATITQTIRAGRRLPIYVAEGSSQAKMRKINSSPYLRHCYDMLSANELTMFVFGHSADENDEHIYEAIFGSGAEELYFGVYKPSDDKIKKIDALLAKYQKLYGHDVEYSFYDAESAHIWDAVPEE